MSLGSIFGGKPSQTTNSNSTSTPTFPDWISQLQQTQGNLAGGLLNIPYQSYGGELVSPYNSTEQQALGLTNSLIGQNQPLFNQATQAQGQVIGNNVNGPNQSALQNYMNPYTSNVLDAQNTRDLQAYQQSKNQLQQQQGAIGAFGGSRSSLAQQQLLNNFNQNEQYNQSSALAGAFNTGLSAYNTGQNTALQAANGLGAVGNLQQQSGLSAINSLMGQGQLQQQTQQAQDTANYGQFQNQIAYPYQQASYYQGLTQPLSQLNAGNQSNSTSTQTSSQGGGALGDISSLFSSIPGLGGGLSSIGGSLLGNLLPSAASSFLGNAVGAGTSFGSSILDAALLVKDGGQIPFYRNGGQVSNNYFGQRALHELANQFEYHPTYVGKPHYRSGGLVGGPRINRGSTHTPKTSYGIPGIGFTHMDAIPGTGPAMLTGGMIPHSRYADGGLIDVAQGGNLAYGDPFGEGNGVQGDNSMNISQQQQQPLYDVPDSNGAVSTQPQPKIMPAGPNHVMMTNAHYQKLYNKLPTKDKKDMRQDMQLPQIDLNDPRVLAMLSKVNQPASVNHYDDGGQVSMDDTKYASTGGAYGTLADMLSDTIGSDNPLFNYVRAHPVKAAGDLALLTPDLGPVLRGMGALGEGVFKGGEIAYDALKASPIAARLARLSGLAAINSPDLGAQANTQKANSDPNSAQLIPASYDPNADQNPLAAYKAARAQQQADGIDSPMSGDSNGSLGMAGNLPMSGNNRPMTNNAIDPELDNKVSGIMKSITGNANAGRSSDNDASEENQLYTQQKQQLQNEIDPWQTIGSQLLKGSDHNFFRQLGQGIQNYQTQKMSVNQAQRELAQRQMEFDIQNRKLEQQMNYQNSMMPFKQAQLGAQAAHTNMLSDPNSAIAINRDSQSILKTMMDNDGSIQRDPVKFQKAHDMAQQLAASRYQSGLGSGQMRNAPGTSVSLDPFGIREQ